MDRRLKSRKPSWPYQINRASLQERGLVFWWPGDPAGKGGWEMLRRENVPQEAGFAWGSGNDGRGSAGTFVTGSASALTPPTAPAVGDAITVSAWIYPTSLPSGGMNGIVYYFQTTTPGTSGDFALAMRDNNGSSPGRLAFQHSGVNLFWTTTNVIVAGQWNHVLARSDAGGLNFLVNGKFYDIDSSENLGAGWTADFKIGEMFASSAWRFPGRIEDVRIYDHRLPESVCLSMYWPETRYDLYWQPGRRRYFVPEEDTPASNPPDWKIRQDLKLITRHPTRVGSGLLGVGGRPISVRT